MYKTKWNLLSDIGHLNKQPADVKFEFVSIISNFTKFSIRSRRKIYMCVLGAG